MAATKRKTVTRKKGGISNSAIVVWFQEWTRLNAARKQTEARERELRDRLMEAVETRGYPDHDGHYWFDLPEEIEGFEHLKRERRVSQSFDTQGAMELVYEKGLEKRCIKMVPTLDEDAFMAAVADREITEKEYDALITKRETWAFKPQA